MPLNLIRLEMTIHYIEAKDCNIVYCGFKSLIQQNIWKHMTLWAAQIKLTGRVAGWKALVYSVHNANLSCTHKRHESSFLKWTEVLVGPYMSH